MAARKYTPEQRESKRKYLRRWRAANPERARNISRKYRATRTPEQRAAKQEYDRAYHHRRYHANPEKVLKVHQEYRAANPENVRKSSRKASRKWRAANPEHQRKWRAANPEKSRAYCRKWRAANPEKNRTVKRAWEMQNPGRAIANNARRHASKMQRTPAWADLKAIASFYEACPQGHHVDHFYPLQGREVSGLHVLSNLRYMPASENARKHNSTPRVQIFHLPTAEEIRRLDRKAKPQPTQRGRTPRSAETSAEMNCHG